MAHHSPGTQLFRPPTPAEAELAHLRATLARQRADLSAREHALDELRRHLLSFEGRYIRQVGKLYKQLDEWERRIAALHPEQEANDAEPDEDSTVPPETTHSTTRTPQPSTSLRSLFRELARRIHPDHALDDADEARRTRLMAQANDAFRRKDARILRRLLRGFDAGAHAHTIEQDVQDTREALAQIARDIIAVEADHAALQASQLAELERNTIAAARDGRDLLAEMAARVKGRIGLAMRQYELDQSRIKRPGRGLKLEDLLSAENTTTRRR